MTATVISATTVGVEARLVHVEVDTDRKLPSFTLVGLPDSAKAAHIQSKNNNLSSQLSPN
jgi:hypothetical protein